MSSLKEYGELFERLGLTELSVEEKDLKLTLKKDYAGCGAGAAVSETSSGAWDEDDGKRLEKLPEGTEIKAPILGVFYANETPLKEGDTVEKGDVLCTLEAMKMMNEVRSSSSGRILKVLANDGSLVEYHQTLFVIG